MIFLLFTMIGVSPHWKQNPPGGPYPSNKTPVKRLAWSPTIIINTQLCFSLDEQITYTMWIAEGQVQRREGGHPFSS